MDTFNELNVDPMEGAEIMKLANISVEDLRGNEALQKVRGIMSFFQGKTDKAYMITKLIAGKPGINSIDHLYGYATLRTDYDKMSVQLNNIKEQISYYER